MKLSLMGNGSKKRIIFLAVTLAVTANLLLGDSVSAEKIKISQVDVERIKLVLDLAKTILSIAVSDEKLKTVLDMTTKGAESGADITYGLLVLTSLNEMDFIDSVVSQRYKGEATAYFESILNERTNLRNYYKGIGYDLPRVLAGRITSPMAALTLNTFDITEKTIAILTAIEVLKKEQRYEGLWFYFDLRKSGNEPHEVAWEEAEIKMGIVTKPVGFHRGVSRKEEDNNLEAQFAALYDKWGPYVEINKGVKKEFKEQVRMELQNTLALAAEEQALAEKEKENKLSFLGKMLKEAEKAMVRIQELAGLGGAQISQITIDGGEKGEKGVSQLEIGSPILDIGEVQEILDDISEKIDILAQGIKESTASSAEVRPPLDIPQEKEVAPVAEEPPVVFNYGEPMPPSSPSAPPAPSNQIPVAGFSFAPQNPSVGQEIIFNAASSSDSDGTITSYVWDFGDSTFSTTTEATATHNYSAPGDFSISLTAVDNNNATGSAATIINITVPEIPFLW